ncbi:DMT family transporter, partial [Microcoleus sp. CAWBG640]|uniref:DMT family transporter n=1 Tax=Microcoleus sp. CAWBG640 TaxID=2841653 RepID=UPI00312B6470
HHFAEVLSPFLWQWMIIYAAVIVVTGQLCWLAGLKNATSTELNLASLLNPIAAIIMGYLILGEAPTFAQYLGGSLLFVGMIFGFVGNLYQAKINRSLVNPNPRDAMETAIGFRGV